MSCLLEFLTLEPRYHVLRKLKHPKEEPQVERKEGPQTCFTSKLPANSQHQLVSHEMSGLGIGSTSHSQTTPIDIMWGKKNK